MRTLFAFLAIAVAGCATVRQPEPGAPVPEPAPPFPAPAARTENLAIAGLLDGARADAAAGRLANAAASLERALRIEPRNPRLWQELARVRLKQGDYAQAESTAARSNSWAGSDNALRADNWRIIAHARNARLTPWESRADGDHDFRAALRTESSRPDDTRCARRAARTMRARWGSLGRICPSRSTDRARLPPEYLPSRSFRPQQNPCLVDVRPGRRSSSRIASLPL